MLVESLFWTWPLADVGPWALGWEFVLALVTLLLAGVTGGLAWTTRRLARATVEEVQGQSRPVVVPRGTAVQVGERWVDPNQEGKVPYPLPGSVPGERNGSFTVTIPVRNIGVGPALNLEGEVKPDRYPTNRVTALPPGEEAEVGLTISLYNEGAHPFHHRVNTLAFTYFDLAGRQFTTSFSWSVGAFGGEGLITAYLVISSGELPGRRQPPQITEDEYADPFRLARGRFWPSGWAVRKAWATLSQLPEYGGQLPLAAPLPFRMRISAAWRELFPRRQVQRFQRLAWGARVSRASRAKPVPYPLPRFVAGPYRVARGVKWAWLTYFRMR